MGYTTRFQGQLDFSRELSHAEWLELMDMADYDKQEKGLLKEYTDTPETIPDSYLQWEPNKQGTALVWNAEEKFYDYIHWLRWLIKHWFAPRAIELNGQLVWQGEEIGDVGVLKVEKNKVTSKKGTVKTVTCPNCGEEFIND